MCNQCDVESFKVRIVDRIAIRKMLDPTPLCSKPEPADDVMNQRFTSENSDFDYRTR